MLVFCVLPTSASQPTGSMPFCCALQNILLPDSQHSQVHQELLLLIHALQKVNAESCTCQWQESDVVARSHLAAAKQGVSGGSFGP
jgi:hypothetical protein